MEHPRGVLVEASLLAENAILRGKGWCWGRATVIWDQWSLTAFWLPVMPGFGVYH